MADLSPQYTGTQYAAGQAPAATISAENPELRRDFERNTQATLGSIIQLDDELMEANDFALQQNRIPRAKALATNFENEMKERTALPDGDTNALFDKNGKFRQDLFNARVSSYTNQLKGMDSGFMTARGQEFARKAVADTRTAIEQYAAAAARGALKERAFRSFESNFYDALNAGQYNLAINYALQAQQNKILPQGADSIYYYKTRVRQQYNRDYAKKASATGGTFSKEALKSALMGMPSADEEASPSIPVVEEPYEPQQMEESTGEYQTDPNVPGLFPDDGLLDPEESGLAYT